MRAKSSGGRAKSAGRSRRGRSQQTATYAVQLLKQDHRQVEDLMEQFEEAQEEQKKAVADQICQLLTVHAQIEEEAFYPAAREALDEKDAHLVAEANVEHATVKELISQLESMDQVDEMFEAKVKVLGHYVEHHVQEEETELFPKVEQTDLDLDAIGQQLAARKAELLGEGRGDMPTQQDQESEEESSGRQGRSRPGSRGGRPSLIHSGRHR
jgi:hemerythrin superfamily protein